MRRDFKIIVITSPDDVANEISIINKILDSGVVDFLHIRKPDYSLEKMREMISAIPLRLHKRLKVHSHFQLVEEFDLGGIHINGKTKDYPKFSKKISISKSCHTLEELNDIKDFDYVTLSPIYDSISKVGYKSKFNLRELTSDINDKNIIALGGITPNEFKELKDYGFLGAALLGYIWSNADEIDEKLLYLKSKI